MLTETASNPAISVAHGLLYKYYPKVCTLLDYLYIILEGFSPIPEEAYGASNETLQELDDLLRSTLVGYYEPPTSVRFQSRPPEISQEETIDRAQLVIFKTLRGKNNNVLCFGYRQAEQRNEFGKLGAQRGAIANFFTNTMVTALQSPAWRLLLRMTGEQPMIHILSQTSIFLALPTGNDCFAQATGTVITDLEQLSDTRPTKSSIRSPVDINLIRTRMFYGFPRLTASGKSRLGLPHGHVLNRIPDGPKNLADHDDIREVEEAARHVAKYMFPLQYRLHNVFTCTLHYWENGGRLRDYRDREVEIKERGSCKTPKRLKAILPLIQSLIRRHRRFNYQPMFNTFDVQVDVSTLSDLDQSKILEIMSEYSHSVASSYMLSQMPDKSFQISHPNLVLPHGASQAALEVKLKPRFVELACSHHEVLRYVKTVVDEVIPHAFWGSSTNRKVIDEHINTIVTQRRFETMTLHQLVQKLRIADFEWLGQTPDRRVAQSDALKRTELLQEFIYWFFDSFIIPLVKSTFYVTETSALQHQLLYFRHDDWHKLCIPLLDKLSGETFERIDPSDLDASRRLGVSHVRLLPKETGVRPIVNLGRKSKLKPFKGNNREEMTQPSVNQILNGAFHILNYEKSQKPELLGASVFGVNDIYRKLATFKASLRRPDGTMPKLYFVKLDVRACFDTIDQGKLLEILTGTLTQRGYMVRKFNQVQPSAGGPRRSFRKRVVPDWDHMHFMPYASKLAACLRHMIFADQVVYGFDYQEETLDLLEEHITDNIVRIGTELYRQVVGIPQGSVLSTLLCAIFYGDLERTRLEFTKDAGNLLLRFVDDYLFITTDIKQARTFLNIMHQGHPEYGCIIAEEKTLTNFVDADVPTLVLAPDTEYFPWCGRVIHMKELSIQWDYGRYDGKHVAHGLTVDYGRQPGTKFKTRFLQMARQHCHAMYFDASLTSLSNLYVNVAQNFFWIGMKMYNYVREWNIAVDQHVSFISNIITRVVRYAFTSMRSRMNGTLAQDMNATCEFDSASVQWIGYYAFHSTLSHKRNPSWSRIVLMLASVVNSRRYKRVRSKLGGIVKRAESSMARVLY
ncbi:telomerase reverse transcriptase [Rhizoctonia solani AG-3 Rhs1AP]|uniref:Telomerase reverse transcriptase n=1 Tax=Rhizoctonia solani AG-3 Rhs1AP TaxID=1086054 RepID=X8JCR4_9AGAM|nr:telomerase reverse transcriptase [Rhizoctonia solani AG-3 Rhs1AP]